MSIASIHSAAPVWVVALVLLLASSGATAAVPVEESVEESESNRRAATTPQTESRTPTRSARSNPVGIPPTIEPTVNTDYDTDPNADRTRLRAIDDDDTRLYSQVRALREEVRVLRGLVEDQAHLIARLQEDQQRKYLDIDRRLAGIGTAPPQDTASVQPEGTTSSPPATPAVAGARSEREAYQFAFDAMKARQFEASKVGFTQLIEEYPNGQFTPNAFYWLGELHLVADADPEQARQSFMQVVSLYPDHPKTADALYKLGVVYSTLGDNDSAMTYLNRVQVEHPNSSAAGLAAQYAQALQ